MTDHTSTWYECDLNPQTVTYPSNNSAWRRQSSWAEQKTEQSSHALEVGFTNMMETQHAKPPPDLISLQDVVLITMANEHLLSTLQRLLSGESALIPKQKYLITQVTTVFADVDSDTQPSNTDIIIWSYQKMI